MTHTPFEANRGDDQGGKQVKGFYFIWVEIFGAELISCSIFGHEKSFLNSKVHYI